MLERNFPFFNAGFLVALLVAGGIFSIALAGADKNYFVLEGRLTFPEPMQKLPRPGAIVLRPTDHSAGLTAQSDLKGKFRLKKVPSGRYMLEARVGRQWMGRMSVMVSPGLADKNRIIHRSSDEFRHIGKSDLMTEKCSDGHFIGGIQHTGHIAA